MPISPKLFRALHEVFGEEGGDDFVEYMNAVEDTAERYKRIERSLSTIESSLAALRSDVKRTTLL